MPDSVLRRALRSNEALASSPRLAAVQSLDRVRRLHQGRSLLPPVWNTQKAFDLLSRHQDVTKFSARCKLAASNGAAYRGWADPEEIGGFFYGECEACARGGAMFVAQYVSYLCALERGWRRVVSRRGAPLRPIEQKNGALKQNRCPCGTLRGSRASNFNLFKN